MLERYVAFCIADPVFYEPMARLADGHSHFDATRRTPPLGWTRSERDIWVCLSPASGKFPEQGWKIHVSADLAQAGEVIDLVSDYCLENNIPYKHLRSRLLHLICNAKYAPRASSGKLMALYPDTEERLRRALDDLSARLKGFTGPYILSDLRWGDGPLYTRFGGFVEQYCSSDTGA